MSTARALQAWGAVKATHNRVDLKWGPTNADRLLGGAKRVGFFHARYEFAAKMLRDRRSIIDVGCGDGTGMLSFLDDTAAQNILGLDFEEMVIDYAVDDMLPALASIRPQDAERLEFVARDFLKSSFANYEGLCCLDVIEHVDPVSSPAFIAKAAETLAPRGIAVIGSPSLASAPFASKHSQAGHINLYDPERFRSELSENFGLVLEFSMTHCVVTAGFDPLARYYIAVCVK